MITHVGAASKVIELVLEDVNDDTVTPASSCEQVLKPFSKKIFCKSFLEVSSNSEDSSDFSPGIADGDIYDLKSDSYCSESDEESRPHLDEKTNCKQKYKFGSRSITTPNGKSVKIFPDVSSEDGSEGDEKIGLNILDSAEVTHQDSIISQPSAENLQAGENLALFGSITSLETTVAITRTENKPATAWYCVLLIRIIETLMNRSQVA